MDSTGIFPCINLIFFLSSRAFTAWVACQQALPGCSHAVEFFPWSRYHADIATILINGIIEMFELLFVISFFFLGFMLGIAVHHFASKQSVLWDNIGLIRNDIEKILKK